MSAAHDPSPEQVLAAMQQLAAALLLAIRHAEDAAALLRAERALGGRPIGWGVLEDHRVEVLGEIIGSLDAVEPGFSRRVFAAMYPFSEAEDDDDGTPDAAPPAASLLCGACTALALRLSTQGGPLPRSA